MGARGDMEGARGYIKGSGMAKEFIIKTREKKKRGWGANRRNKRDEEGEPKGEGK